jgi:hypothetical protein
LAPFPINCHKLARGLYLCMYAFTCISRKFALERAFLDRSKDPEVNKFLGTLLAVLEKEKASLNVTPEQGRATCENFADSGQ